MAIDSHMHVNSLVTNNINKTINDVNDNKNIDCVINVGLNIKTSKESIDISKNNTKFYSSIGIHPIYIENENINDLYNLVNDKVVAVGEIGIDTTNNNIRKQKKYLIKQIAIANELKLPVIIHTNNNKIIIEIFKKYIKPKYGCVFHWFKPDLDDLKYIINNEYYISFAGRITYKTANKSIEVAKIVPNDFFIVETDSPYISPEPLRNEINKSENIKYIVQKLSEIKNINYEEIERITTKNTKTLFKKINN